MSTSQQAIVGAIELERLLTKLGSEQLATKSEIAKIARQATEEVNRELILPKYQMNALALNNQGSGMASKIASAIRVRKMMKLRRHNYGAVSEVASEADFVTFTKESSFDIQTRKQVSGKRYFVPAAIEFGHAFPGRGGGKNAPKDVPARPFAKTAYESIRYSAIVLAQNKMLDKLYKFVKSNKTKGA